MKEDRIEASPLDQAADTALQIGQIAAQTSQAAYAVAAAAKGGGEVAGAAAGTALGGPLGTVIGT